jgi:quinol monooxygenase YgiN
MIIVIATLTFAGDRDEALLAAANRVQDVCRSLPGCLCYELSASLTSTSELMAAEVWDDIESFERHIAVVEAHGSLSLWRERLTGVSAAVYDGTELPGPPTDPEEQT